MLGATTREIAPDAVLAVHSPRVVVYFRGAGTPTREMRAAATERGLQRADGMLKSYFAKMGADIGLLDLARTVKFEDMHVLTREEIARFGIDRRELTETPWILEGNSRSMVRKIATQREEGDKAYRMAQWRLFCFSTDRFELDFQRPTVTSSIFPTILISNGGSISQYFKPAPVRTPGFEIWGLRMTRASLQALADELEFDLTETTQAQDGRARPNSPVRDWWARWIAWRPVRRQCPQRQCRRPVRGKALRNDFGAIVPCVGSPVTLKTRQSEIRVSTALKVTPGNCSAVPSKSTMLPLSAPLSVSVIMSVPNNGLNAGSGLWRCVVTLA
jgi:hypothetical protein